MPAVHKMFLHQVKYRNKSHTTVRKSDICAILREISGIVKDFRVFLLLERTYERMDTFHRAKFIREITRCIPGKLSDNILLKSRALSQLFIHLFYLFHNMLGNTINKDEITQSNNNIAESLTRPHLSQSF